MKLNEEILLDNLGKIAYTLDKSYMTCLETDYTVLPFDEYYNSEEAISYSSNIRALKVSRWIYDKEEKIADCFKNVLSVFAGTDNTVSLVLHRTPKSTDMYFVVKNVGLGRNEESKSNIDLLADSLLGNFPGSDVEVIDGSNSKLDIKELFEFKNAEAVACLSNIPSEKSNDYISQGVEKLLNGIVPKKDEESYYIVILAEALSQLDLRQILNGYEEMATAITPYAGYQYQQGNSETDTSGEMESSSLSEGISHAVTKTHSINIGVNGGVNSSSTKSIGMGMLLGPLSIFTSVAKTVGWSAGASAGYGYSWGTTDTKSSTDTKTTGTNHSVSIGTSENTTFTYKSYMVSNIIEKLENTIQRINKSQSTGLWKTASYVFSSDTKTSKNIASFLRAISQGDESFVEPSAIQAWTRDYSNGITPFSEIQKYIRHFSHPIFVNKDDGVFVNPSSNVTTTELSNIFAFPRYSVQGIPVMKCCRFGREPHSLLKLEKDFSIGCSYHMHQSEPQNKVFLNKNEFTKHTFITGSTGSGKSNAVYKLLEEMCKQNDECKFLVIEPAKGEYKDIFGGREDVDIYGTNPLKFPKLLQLNPFSFPDDIHVLEHIDRLVEVFNACWPMYAAMPAILKEAVERSYEECGWNLRLSKNPGKFPTFSTLLRILPIVVDTSGYSQDTSNDYKGALVTRVRSLTRGIHGQIFEHDITSEKLFNSNTIIDLSRIGSPETKALIMGILILKLQEFRMSENIPSNSNLRHLTVFEEAHILLRRTSGEQSQESSNLQGKAVEMLANAIAEMRTYGEGFIIADQSPGLMDMSVIRNTNTKIILRLLDESDRVLVGKAAGLNDAQVDELSKLERGVAVISQSDWLEPVLCKIDRFDDAKPYRGYDNTGYTWIDKENCAIQKFVNLAFGVEKELLSKDDADIIREWYSGLGLTTKARFVFESILENKPVDAKQKMLLVYYMIGTRLNEIPDRNDAIEYVKNTFASKFDISSDKEVVRCINELFIQYFPVNFILNNSIEQTERMNEVNKL